MTKYIDGTQEPDEAFATVLAEFDAAPPTVEQMTGVLLTAILGDTDGGLVLEGDLPAAEIARLIAEVAAPAALAVFRGQQDPAMQRLERVDQLSREHFGEWVDVPDRQAGGYLYVVRDEFHDGYPSRYLVLVHDDGTGDELEFTDSDPIQYPKTMRTPCTIRAAIGGDGR